MIGDPSSFYRLNEEIALELQRLERAGDLDRLLGLLKGANVELHVVSARPREGFEELIGALRPKTEASAPALASLRDLPPDDGEAPLGCAPEQDAELAAPSGGGGWDHEGVLAARSRFTVLLPNGQAHEVYMPDHICPACRNDAGNVINECSRVCGSCEFAW